MTETTIDAATSRPIGADIRRVTPRAWADIAVLLVLTVLAVIGFEPSFGGYGFLLAGLGGIVLGAATGILASMFRLTALTTVLAAVAAYFLLGTPFAVPSQATLFVLPSLQSLASLAQGAVFGWADIVTLSTPIGAPKYIAVVPYVATWIVALVSTTLATRWLAARPRTAWRFGVALIAPLALYVTGILIGTDEPYQSGLRGIVFGVLALIWLGWRRQGATVAQSSASTLRNRKLAGTAIIVAGSILLGGVAGFWTAPPNDQRFVLRDEIQPPFDPLDYPSPLSGFRHYTKQVTDDVLFTVSGLEVGDTIRLATLDTFTGKLWNVTGPESSANGSGSFELVGRELPTPTLITPVQRDDVTFTIEGYDDVWLPSLGYPTTLSFTGGDAENETDNLRYNASTGTAVLTSGLRKGDTYTLDAEVQKVIPVEQLADAKIANIELPDIDGSPDIVTVRAGEYAGSATTPIAQLEAIRLALTNNGFLSHGRASDTVPSRAGHGADRITDLFERTQMVGDQEQYASAYALMARSLGYPARVVMGYAPEVVEGQSSTPVTGDDVTVWTEVAFAGTGWVSFNPTPDETDIPQDQVPKPQSEPQPQVRQPPRADNDDEDLLSPVELEESDDTDKELGFLLPGWVWVVALSILIPAILFFTPILIIGAIKTRRARKRRTMGARHDRVAGAWEELTDRYSELGYVVPPKLTRILVADSLEQQVQAPEALRLRGLAIATDEAVFSGQEIDEARSEIVWTEAMAAVAVAHATLGRGRRLLSRFRVRSARDWIARKGSGTS
ncbi:MAG: transglutaminaseTgpA domain-containing protein [Rhodoglobus sp.]